MKTKMTSTLKSDSGASIIFVLCTLLFVMTVGVSVLVASSAAAGAATDSHTHTKAELYSDSLIKSVTKVFKGDIGKAIVVKTANDGLTGTDVSKPTDFLPAIWTLKEIKIGNLPEQASYTVTATISASANDTSLVTNYSFIPEIPEIKAEDGTVVVLREPSILMITLEAKVNTKVKYGGKTVSINSTYICDGIEIYDKTSATDTDDEFGEWRLVKIEKVE